MIGAQSMRVLTHNAMCCEDAFDAPGEIARRDALMASTNLSKADAEKALLKERFKRQAAFLSSVRPSLGIIGLQVRYGD